MASRRSSGKRQLHGWATGDKEETCDNEVKKLKHAVSVHFSVLKCSQNQCRPLVPAPSTLPRVAAHEEARGNCDDDKMLKANAASVIRNNSN